MKRLYLASTLVLRFANIEHGDRHGHGDEQAHICEFFSWADPLDLERISWSFMAPVKGLYYLRPKPKTKDLGSCSMGRPFTPRKRSGLKSKGSW